MAIQITADISGFRRELRSLGTKAPLAAARALNRSMASVQTQAVRELAGDLGIAQRDVRRGMALQRATRSKLSATLTVTGRRIPLIAFKAKGPEPSRGRGRVTYRIGSRARTTVAGAFITTMRSGHRGVFRRRGIPRLPILELFGPSLPRVFTQAKITAARTRLAAELLAKNLAHEIRFLVSGSRNAA